MDSDDNDIEQIKNTLRSRLKQSGVNNLIRHMVRDICEAHGDTETLEPQEIVEELYSKGLMKTVMDNVEWTENLRRELQLPEKLASSLAEKQQEQHPSPNPSVPERESEAYFQHLLGETTTTTTAHSELHEEISFFDATMDKPEHDHRNPGPEKESPFIAEHLPENGAGEQRGKVSSSSRAKHDPAQDFTVVVEEVPHVRQTSGRLNGKYYLKLELVGGKSFLDQLFDSERKRNSSFILHLSYRGQRFYAKPTPADCDPKFQGKFMIDIGYYENGSVLQMLTKLEPLHIILIQETLAGDRTLLSSCMVDWRGQLMSDKDSQKLPITLMGIGSEYQVPVGVLNTRLTIVPHLEEILSSSTYAAQINAEKSIQDEKERLFLIYVKQWWREFVEIRPQHNKRNVKVFSYDENTIPRPIQTFVKPIVSDRLLLTPLNAAWFVSLIATLDESSGDSYQQNIPTTCTTGLGSAQVLCSHWQSLICTLTTKVGRVEDRATLLCSLLLGFGLDAYVAIGNKNGGASWVWVVTFEQEHQVTFWESTKGTRFPHYSIPTTELLEEKLSRMKTMDGHGIKTISCLFNNSLLYANIQNTTFVDVVDWNLSNPSKWKKIPESTLKSSSKFNEVAPTLLPPTINPLSLSSDIEVQLKTLVSEHRRNNSLHTTWDNSLSLILGQELAKYELESCTGHTPLPGYFQTAILKNMPGGYEFKGYPWRGNRENPHHIFRFMTTNAKCQEILRCRGSDVQLALRVQVFIYPEDVCSVRLMLACKFIPAG